MLNAKRDSDVCRKLSRLDTREEWQKCRQRKELEYFQAENYYLMMDTKKKHLVRCRLQSVEENQEFFPVRN